jgi:hypothetical protein
VYISEWDWDDDNVEHIAEKGLRPRDIDQVWEENPKYRRNKKHRAASHQMIGPDFGGRFVTAFIRQDAVRSGLWRVITARESDVSEMEWWRRN